jgi:hypothetical protein
LGYEHSGHAELERYCYNKQYQNKNEQIQAGIFVPIIEGQTK